MIIDDACKKTSSGLLTESTFPMGEGFVTERITRV